MSSSITGVFVESQICSLDLKWYFRSSEHIFDSTQAPVVQFINQVQYNTDEIAKYHWPTPQHYELNLKIQSSKHILVDLAFISHECNVAA